MSIVFILLYFYTNNLIISNMRKIFSIEISDDFETLVVTRDDNVDLLIAGFAKAIIEEGHIRDVLATSLSFLIDEMEPNQQILILKDLLEKLNIKLDG